MRILAGVPLAQEKIIQDEFSQTFSEFWVDKIDHLFKTVPMHDNYF